MGHLMIVTDANLRVELNIRLAPFPSLDLHVGLFYAVSCIIMQARTSYTKVYYTDRVR